MKYLVFDISNLLYRTFFVQRQETEEVLAGLATHTALVMLNKYFKQHKPDRVVMAFDRSSWRKEYTKSEQCISKKPYKGNRRNDMTPAQQAKYAEFLRHIDEFEKLIDKNTTVITLVKDRLEADDLVAGFCQKYSGDDNEIVIISTDSDLLQLAKHGSVRVISPATDKEQSLEDFNNDPELYVFAKCIRGDPTDNIQSAYPRVQMKRIVKAYNDKFECVELMKEKWKNDVGEFEVGQLFEENQKLINLEMQPPEIRKIIDSTIDEAMTRDRVFSLFHMLRFLGKYKLVRIKDAIDQYIPMLSK